MEVNGAPMKFYIEVTPSPPAHEDVCNQRCSQEIHSDDEGPPTPPPGH